MTRTRSVTAIGLCAMLAMVIGCDGKDKSKDAPATDTSAASTSATTPKDEAKETTAPEAKAGEDADKKKAPKAKAPERKVASKNKEESRELQQKFKEHLREGRKLVQAKKYKEGLEVFEKARVIDPNNARILSEIGWAAYLAGDYERAIQANNDSVRFAKQDKLKGASLYNLGRVAEAQKDLNRAVDYYERSLTYRENKTVRAHLAKARGDGGESEREKVDIYSFSTGCSIVKLEGSDLNDACRELALGLDPAPECSVTSFGGDVSPVITKIEGGNKLTEVAPLVMYVESDWTEYYILGLKYDGSWYITPLVWVYNPGAFGIYEDLGGIDLSVEQLVPGGEPELVVRTTHSRHDTDLGLDEEEDEESHRLLVVGEHDGEPMVMVSALTSYSYKRERIGSMPDDELPGDLVTKDLPIESKSGIEVTFDKKGSVTIAKKDGFELPKDTKLGTRPLIDGACKE